MQRVLRDNVLGGKRVALVAGAASELLASLGAQTLALDADLRDEEAMDAAATALGEVDALVVDAATLFSDAERLLGAPRGASDRRSAGDELAPLRAAADGTWSAVRAVANAAWIGPGRPGKLVVLAPRPDAGPHAEAARAALENLARTTSIEWARYGITTTTITPGAATSDADAATIVAYLVSPAGDYFSGARLDLA